MELLKNKQKLMKDFIRNQLEFYFSDDNLEEDIYLAKIIEEHEFVPLLVLMTFDRVRKITLDMGIIIQAISDSKVLQMNEDASKVKRIKSFKKICTKENISTTWNRQTKRMIESRFDDYYLSKNPQLFKLIEEDSQGFVKLEYFKNHDFRLAEIEGTELIAAALSNSTILEVSKDGTGVRKTHYPFSPKKKDSQILIVKNLSQGVSGTTMRNMFEQYGKIDMVKFLKSKDGKKKECYIQFHHPESVSKACEKFQHGKTDVSKKGVVRNTTESDSNTSELLLSTKAEDVSDSDPVYYITKSFENLETAGIGDTDFLEDELLQNGKRKIPNETERPSKRVHFKEDSSLQDKEMDDQSGSEGDTETGEASTSALQMEVLPMSKWKKIQINELRLQLKSMEQLEGFGEKGDGNGKEQSEDPVNEMQPETSS